MRCLLFAAVSAVAVLTAAGSNPAAAQGYPYCLKGGDWGWPGLCQFSTYEQCWASASGTRSYCGIDPYYAFARQRLGKAIGRATDPTKPRRGRLPRSGGGCRKAISPKPKNI